MKISSLKPYLECEMCKEMIITKIELQVFPSEYYFEGKNDYCFYPLSLLKVLSLCNY